MHIYFLGFVLFAENCCLGVFWVGFGCALVVQAVRHKQMYPCVVCVKT